MSRKEDETEYKIEVKECYFVYKENEKYKALDKMRRLIDEEVNVEYRSKGDDLE